MSPEGDQVIVVRCPCISPGGANGCRMLKTTLVAYSVYSCTTDNCSGSVFPATIALAHLGRISLSNTRTIKPCYCKSLAQRLLHIEHKKHSIRPACHIKYIVRSRTTEIDKILSLVRPSGFLPLFSRGAPSTPFIITQTQLSLAAKSLSCCKLLVCRFSFGQSLFEVTGSVSSTD